MSRLGLLAALQRAIAADELTLHYQPQVELGLGVEALVRWPHPQHGMIPPNRYISPAE